MEGALTLGVALGIGFTHAFEADHLIAVSSLVTKRNKPLQAIKDGVFWGLGHTSTIFLVGIVMVVGKFLISEKTFGVLEALVGLMLVGLGIWRLRELYDHRHEDHHHGHTDAERHGLAYGIGMVHGLAGSGALVLLVISQMKSSVGGMLYLLVFGVGSIFGMLIASGVLSMPFSKNVSSNRAVQVGLSLISAFLCIGFGAHVLYENLMG